MKRLATKVFSVKCEKRDDRPCFVVTEHGWTKINSDKYVESAIKDSAERQFTKAQHTLAII